MHTYGFGLVVQLNQRVAPPWFRTKLAPLMAKSEKQINSYKINLFNVGLNENRATI